MLQLPENAAYVGWLWEFWCFSSDINMSSTKEIQGMVFRVGMSVL